MNRKTLSLIVVLIMIMSMTIVSCKTTKQPGGGQKEIPKEGEKPTAKKPLKVAMVTDTGGINDQSFNQSAWAGLKKAKEKLGININFLESSQESDYAPNLETLYDAGNNLIWGIGYLMGDAVYKAAQTNTEQKYAIVDESYVGKKIPDNLVAVTFRENEPSFLVGYIAGKMTKTNKVGFIGGMEFDVIKRFESGYRAGVKTANPDCEILIQYANAFGDVAKGKSIANQMYQNGADIVFHAAGFTGVGVIESAEENGKYVIGVDQDQRAVLGKKAIITSAVKRVDEVVYRVVEDLTKGKFSGGTNIVYGLAEGAVGIAPTSKEAVPQNILNEVDKLKKDIIEGKIKVPKTREEFKNQFAK